MNLRNYLSDGASAQTKAVLALFQNFEIHPSGREVKLFKYKSPTTTDIKVGRWENGREQGYIFSLLSKDFSKQLNITIFEHRNSDNLCAVKWEQKSINSITIDTAQFGDVYKTKYDVSHQVKYGEILKMVEWIEQQFNEFWNEKLKD